MTEDDVKPGRPPGPQEDRKGLRNARPDRDGKVQLGAYLDPVVRDGLDWIRKQRGRVTRAALVAEALALLFERERVPNQYRGDLPRPARKKPPAGAGPGGTSR